MFSIRNLQKSKDYSVRDRERRNKKKFEMSRGGQGIYNEKERKGLESEPECPFS